MTLLLIPIAVFILCQVVASSSTDGAFWSYYGTFVAVASNPVSWLLFVLVPVATCGSILAIR